MERGRDRGHPLRILHIVGGMRPGGVENWLLRVMRSVDRGRYEMDFVVHSDERCDYDSEILRLGGRIFPCPHTDRPWRYAREFLRILGESGPYDLVHSHVFLYSGFVLSLARWAGVPARLAHFHTPLEAESTGPSRASYRATMLALIARCSTSILANSRSTLQSLGRATDGDHPGDQVVYPLTRDVPPPAGESARRRIREKYGLPLDEPVVIYLARFAPLKNHAQVVRIADLFRDRSARGHFVMAGSHGVMLDHHREAAKGRANLTLLSEFDDPMELLACADVFFFPSLKEGFGIVAYEAAASGLPVVASDLAGLREAVAPACHGFLFPPDVDAEAADRLTRLLIDGSLRSEVAAASRAWAESMSPGQSILKLLAIYDAARVRIDSSSSPRSTFEVHESDAVRNAGRPMTPSSPGRCT